MIEFKNICKSFSGIPALSNINFYAKSGEILALLGQNGAGKSTLMKILSGAYPKDSGEIYINNKKVEISSPIKAEKEGIGIVYQELSGIPHLSVSDNIVLGKDPHKGIFLDRRTQDNVAKKALKNLEAENIPLSKKLGQLSISEQQICEIAKCTANNPQIVVFDEPTTSLTKNEREDLFKIMDIMRKRNLTIIFVTHYLEEAVRMCDKCLILRDGQVTYFGTMKGLDEKKIIDHMIGQHMENFFPEYKSYTTDKIALEVSNLTDGDKIKPTNLKVRYGEVLGLSGLIGSGRTELAHIIFGARKRAAGKIFINGIEKDIKNENDGIRSGIAYINEDRRIGGLNLSMPIDFNLALTSLCLARKSITGKIFVKDKKIEIMTQEIIEKLSIKCSSTKQKLVHLSGGNQQKVSIGKWLVTNMNIFIFDEPTKGIDVSAKAKIYEVIRDLAKVGCAVIVISSYNPELIGVCDRISVMSKGRITGTFDRGITEEQLMLEQTGIGG